MKFIGWILIVCGIIAIITNGISLTFEGLLAAGVPIIMGIFALNKD